MDSSLWSSILDSVSSTRAIATKHVVVLGRGGAGKSVLASALLQKGEDERGFALGYDWADVRDDDDTLARLSVYTVPSDAHAYTALLPPFLPPRTALAHTLVMIVLDWTRPWAFLDDLYTWLRWVDAWAATDASREAQLARDENRERLQAHLQHYAEPSADALPNLSAATVLPLGPGTLTHNPAGVPIVVVCTKADLIDDGSDLVGAGPMVKGKGGEWEERTDTVMQVLRTVCLKYGAALFYTTPQPSTLSVLRQYALHFLFMPPAPPPDGSEPPAPARNPFVFHHRPNTLDRDRIVVPAGWDSWGKIAVLRDGFEARIWGEAWDADLADAPDNGARKMYRTLVPDQGAKPPPLPPFNAPMAEQAFLAKHFDENSKKPDRDPRGAFRNPAESATAGIVGPLGSSSFSLPTVEKALAEMESGLGPTAALNASVGADPSRRLSRSSTRPVPGMPAPGAAATTAARTTTSPTISSSPGPTGGQTQHEVLQNFFQSLLSSKDRAGASAAASRAAAVAPKPNGSPSGTDEG